MAVQAGEDDLLLLSSFGQRLHTGDNCGTSTLQGQQSYPGSCWEWDHVLGYGVRFPLGTNLVYKQRIWSPSNGKES